MKIQAYNPEWVKNLYIRKTAKAWQQRGMISEDQLKTVMTTFPEDFYRADIYVRIGLFIFGAIACLFSAVFLGAGFIWDGSDKAMAVGGGLMAIVYFTCLEVIIPSRRLYHSGFDNVVLYAGLSALFMALVMLTQNAPVELWCCFALLLLVPATLRYADLFVVFVAYGALLMLIGRAMLHLAAGKALLPFAIMLVSAVLFLLSRKIDQVYYSMCGKVIYTLSLAVFYLAGNYYVVREGNAMIAKLPDPMAPQIDFPWIFYLFTTVVPLLYLGKSLKSGNRILLYVGLAAFAFSVFTYKYYFGFLPLEIALTLAGAMMIVFAVWAIRFFKTSRWGLSDTRDSERMFPHLEALVLAHQHAQVHDDGNIEFGGGSFGGGGAEGGY